MVEAKCIVQGLSVGCKKMQTMVLSIFEVSEHDNQPELEHELLPQYVIDTGEHDGTVCFFRNDILQYETATRNMSQLRTLDAFSAFIQFAGTLLCLIVPSNIHYFDCTSVYCSIFISIHRLLELIYSFVIYRMSQTF